MRTLLLAPLLTACPGPADTDTDTDTSPDIITTTTLRLGFEPVSLDGDWQLVTEFAFLPDSDELLVLNKDGRVGHLRLDGDTTELLGEFTIPGVYSDGDCGVVSVAFPPDFDDTGHVFVGMCVSLTASGVFRLTLDTSDYDRVADSAVEIIVVEEPEATRPWHNVGSIGFEDDGTMWALFGEKNVRDNAQDPTNNLGGVVRIVPGADGGYTPAPDNPWIDHPDNSPDLYAIGLRSPWRGHMDGDGRLWIGDVGGNDFEEIVIVDGPGLDFGWPRQEGYCDGPCPGVTEPVAAWAHDGVDRYIAQDPDAVPTERRVAWVGPEYVPPDGLDRYGGQLTGRHLFGDLCVGFIRVIDVDAAGMKTMDAHVGHQPQTVAWDQGPDGYLYTVTLGACSGLNNVEGPITSALWRVIAVEEG